MAKPEENIHPQIALMRIGEYQTQHGMTAFTLRSTVKQRCHLLGDILVDPINPDVPKLELKNVSCPNFVIDLIQGEITYDVPKYKERLS